MGALGRDSVRQALFGSNVDRVLRQAFWPGLVVGPLKPTTFASLDSGIAKPTFGKAFVSSLLKFLCLAEPLQDIFLWQDSDRAFRLPQQTRSITASLLRLSLSRVPAVASVLAWAAPRPCAQPPGLL